MATSLEQLMDKVMRMAEKSQERDASNYAQARDDKLYYDRAARGMDASKQRDLMSNARDTRENALTLANMQNVREEGINQRYLDAARIRRGDPVNAEGDIAGNYYDAGGGLAGMGGSGTLSRRGGKVQMTPEEANMEYWARIREKETGGVPITPEVVRAASESFRARAPETGIATALKDSPGLVRAKIDPVSGAATQAIPLGQFASGPRTRENTIPVPGARSPSIREQVPTLQPQPGISTPYGNAPTELSPAQWKAYADSRASGNPDRAMTYQGNQPGMVGDQIARFKRNSDGANFFANTGSARMQAGPAGIQPGPDIEGMRVMRSGTGRGIGPPEYLGPDKELRQLPFSKQEAYKGLGNVKNTQGQVMIDGQSAPNLFSDIATGTSEYLSSLREPGGQLGPVGPDYSGRWPIDEPAGEGYADWYNRISNTPVGFLSGLQGINTAIQGSFDVGDKIGLGARNFFDKDIRNRKKTKPDPFYNYWK